MMVSVVGVAVIAVILLVVVSGQLDPESAIAHRHVCSSQSTAFPGSTLPSLPDPSRLCCGLFHS